MAPQRVTKHPARRLTPAAAHALHRAAGPYRPPNPATHTNSNPGGAAPTVPAPAPAPAPAAPPAAAPGPAPAVDVGPPPAAAVPLALLHGMAGLSSWHPSLKAVTGLHTAGVVAERQGRAEVEAAPVVQ